MCCVIILKYWPLGDTSLCVFNTTKFEGQIFLILDFYFKLKKFLQNAAVKEQGTVKSGPIHKQGQAAIQNGSIKCSNRTHVGLKSQALPLNKHSKCFHSACFPVIFAFC